MMRKGQNKVNKIKNVGKEHWLGKEWALLGMGKEQKHGKRLKQEQRRRQDSQGEGRDIKTDALTF